jgi:hypothetical protein
VQTMRNHQNLPELFFALVVRHSPEHIAPLLEKNHIESVAVPAGSLVAGYTDRPRQRLQLIYHMGAGGAGTA